MMLRGLSGGAAPFLCVLAALAVHGVECFSFQVTLPTFFAGTRQCNRGFGVQAKPFAPRIALRSARTPLALRAVNVDPEDERIPKLSRALESIGMNPEDTVAMFSYDSSEQAILLGYAVVAGKGMPIVQTPDVEHPELVSCYKDNRCCGVITPDEESMSMLMQGEGSLKLQSGCGWDPASPVGPRFCIVIDTHKTPEQLQEEMNCLGRATDEETGLSFQLGLPVECHSFDSLLALADSF